MFSFQNLGKVWTEKKNVPEQRHQTHTNQQQSSSIHHNTRGIRPVHPTTGVTPDKNWTNGGCSRAVNEKMWKKKKTERRLCPEPSVVNLGLLPLEGGSQSSDVKQRNIKIVLLLQSLHNWTVTLCMEIQAKGLYFLSFLVGFFFISPTAQ